jgi:rare lipoprotein A
VSCQASTARRTASAATLALPCIVAALALSACSSAPSRHPTGETARKSGGYYLDDGPQANPPANLDQVPDAEPKLEPIRVANARPYTAMGRTYVPMTELAPYRATGLASWYGKRYNGKPTASGEIYDMYAMTAAHPTLPIPSYARVTNLASDRSVVVRINDRGPFHSDRLIDLSYAAAYKLGILADGSALVEVDSILPGRASPPASAPSEAPLASATSAGGEPSGLPAGGSTAAAAPREVPVTTAAAADRERSGPPVSNEPGGVYVQLGAFGLRQNATSFLDRVQADVGWLVGLAGIYLADGVYRVQVGPYPDREQALQAAARIEQALDLKPVVITR